ncbi:WD40-repeat-containing domain protein [Lactarius vividus]|nr:WD40-repeat-containing domain protein [Lactarius vividus]
MGQYILQKTLVKHGDSVNTLTFSYNGSLFASGADDGLVIVFRGNRSGQELRCFQVKAPITTLHWHSRFGYTIITGDVSGDIHTICLNDSTNRNTYYHTVNNIPGPVHSIVQCATLLAISSGRVVQLIKQGTIGANADVLLVTYLDHGVIAWDLKTLDIKWCIRPRSCKMYDQLFLAHSYNLTGCSTVSPNQKVLAVTNLYDGIDWYSLDSNHFMDISFQHTTPHAISENVILPVTFIHNGTAVLSGTSTGCARITCLKDHSLAESLQHDSGDIVQAVAYSAAGDYRQIVTGVSERGLETGIRYWIQPRTLKRVQPRPKATKDKAMEFLTTHWMPLSVAIVAYSLILWYWDMGGIHWPWSRFSDILGMPPSFTLPWRESGTHHTDLGDDRWDFLLSDELSSTLGSYATEKSQNN